MPGIRKLKSSSDHQQEIEARLQRNREYMRRRRRDPKFRAAQKRADLGRAHRPVAATCGLCGRRAKEVITRLRESTQTKSGFVEVQIAYCGSC